MRWSNAIFKIADLSYDFQFHCTSKAEHINYMTSQSLENIDRNLWVTICNQCIDIVGLMQQSINKTQVINKNEDILSVHDAGNGLKDPAAPVST